MNYRAAIFDLDGTLVDTLTDLAESVNQGLRQLGLPEHAVDAYRHFVGDGAINMVTRALPNDRHDLAEELLTLQKAYYREHFADASRPYHGIEAMLTQLRQAGLPLAILSNKPDAFTQKVVQRLLDADQFTIVRGHVDDVPLKPDPTSALALARELGVEPQDVAYVGDTSIDMRTARSAGFYAVGVTWGFRDRAELEQHGAHTIIDHPDQLPAALNS